ncbi:MAG: ribosome biogenesis GTPase YlqF [Bacilli bacterium]|nr:ribosome biogenesis GTPase YlqF [Bacilli bacterium]
MSKDVHWFPGHMKKASIQIEEKLKIVDCVIELLDARIPFSSRNNQLYELTKNKKRLVVLTKADLADDKITAKWVKYFKEVGFAAIFANINNHKDIQKIIINAEKLGEDKHKKEISRGMKPQPIRSMIIGIPNVGKSTLINKIAGRKAASVENKPGHTKSQQWIKVSNKFELLDTPGILQSNYDDSLKATNLALVGSINENILPNDVLCDQLLNYLKENYSDSFLNRYSLSSIDVANNVLLEEIAIKRGLLVKGGPDINKAQILLLNEFKNGKIGKISLEREPKCL